MEMWISFSPRMMYRSKTTRCRNRRAFTLIEAAAATTVLGIICAMTFIMITRCTAAVAQNSQRMQAFEIARENMEKLLTTTSVTEKVDYGVSEKNPNIEWDTTIEPFTAPAGGMWIRAISSASYHDVNDQPQKVELTCWLTSVPKDIALKIMQDKAILDSNELGPQDFNDPSMMNDPRRDDPRNNGNNNSIDNTGNNGGKPGMSDAEAQRIMQDLLKK